MSHILSQAAAVLADQLDSPAGYELLAMIQQQGKTRVAMMERDGRDHHAHFAHGYKDALSDLSSLIRQVKEASDEASNPTAPPTPNDPISDHAEQRFGEDDPSLESEEQPTQ